MSYMLLIAEPVGQRAERSQAEGKLLYDRMVEFGAELKERGLLIASESLGTGGVRIKKRDGQASLTDGPFAEAKEWIAGFDLVECSDLDEAIEVAAKGPVSWFKTIEIRLFADGPWLGEGAAAFGRGEDGAASPYLLAAWTGRTPAAPSVDQAVTREVKAWRQDLQARGLHILGAELEGPDTATTLRVRAGKTLLGDGTFIKTGEFITGIDVISCADRQRAIQLTAAHPAARYHAIEVRPFQNG